MNGLWAASFRYFGFLGSVYIANGAATDWKCCGGYDEPRRNRAAAYLTARLARAGAWRPSPDRVVFP